MIFSSIFSKKEHTPIVVLIDIQSGLVRGSIVAMAAGQQSRIIYTTLHPFAKISQVNATRMNKLMLHGITEVAAILAREGIKRAGELGIIPPNSTPTIDTVHYILSSPWVMSQTKTVKVDYDTPTTITPRMVDEIVNAKQAGKTDLAGALIEKTIFDVKLNGYPVTKYEGKAVHRLEVSFALSTSPQAVMDKISDALHLAIRPRQEKFHSALLLEYVGIRNIFHTYSDYLVVHPHRELTDVVMVKSGVCSLITSFPFGVGTVIRKLGKVLHVEAATADSTLTMHTAGKLSADEERRLNPIISEIGKGWTHDLKVALAQVGESAMIPRMVFLSSHSHMPFFKNLIMKIPDLNAKISELELPMIESAVVYERGQERSVRMGIYTAAIRG